MCGSVNIQHILHKCTVRLLCKLALKTSCISGIRDAREEASGREKFSTVVSLEGFQIRAGNGSVEYYSPLALNFNRMIMIAKRRLYEAHTKSQSIIFYSKSDQKMRNILCSFSQGGYRT